MKPKGRNDGHKFEYSKVNDQIYLGSDFCQAGVCFLHAEEFKKLGVSVEINLSAEENELPPTGIEGYIWLPVTDGYAPSISQLAVGSSVINEAIKNQKKIYVHCKNGHGRSPTLIAAYLIRYKGYTVEEVLKFIKDKRMESHIEDSQIEKLKEFERLMKK